MLWCICAGNDKIRICTQQLFQTEIFCFTKIDGSIWEIQIEVLPGIICSGTYSAACKNPDIRIASEKRSSFIIGCNSDNSSKVICKGQACLWLFCIFVAAAIYSYGRYD